MTEFRYRYENSAKAAKEVAKAISKEIDPDSFSYEFFSNTDEFIVMRFIAVSKSVIRQAGDRNLDRTMVGNTTEEYDLLRWTGMARMIMDDYRY